MGLIKPLVRLGHFFGSVKCSLCPRQEGKPQLLWGSSWGHQSVWSNIWGSLCCRPMGEATKWINFTKFSKNPFLRGRTLLLNQPFPAEALWASLHFYKTQPVLATFISLIGVTSKKITKSCWTKIARGFIVNVYFTGSSSVFYSLSWFCNLQWHFNYLFFKNPCYSGFTSLIQENNHCWGFFVGAPAS